MNRTNDLMMKRMKKSLALMLLAMVLLLSACGQKPVTASASLQTAAPKTAWVLVI